MPEHVNNPECGCWGCIEAAMNTIGFCVVHLVAEPERIPPASARGSNLCPACEDRMRMDLRLIANRWDEAQAALLPSSGGGNSERHAGRIDPASPIDLAVSHVLQVCRDAVWQVAVDAVDAYDGVRLPDDQTTPGIAEWLARSQLLRITGAEARAWTRECYWKLANAADAIAAQTPGGTVEVPTPHFCKTRVAADSFGVLPPRPCGGELVAIERADGVKSIRCAADLGHSIPWDTWSQMQRARKPRGARVKGLTGPR